MTNETEGTKRYDGSGRRPHGRPNSQTDVHRRGGALADGSVHGGHSHVDKMAASISGAPSFRRGRGENAAVTLKIIGYFIAIIFTIPLILCALAILVRRRNRPCEDEKDR